MATSSKTPSTLAQLWVDMAKKLLKQIEIHEENVAYWRGVASERATEISRLRKMLGASHRLAEQPANPLMGDTLVDDYTLAGIIGVTPRVLARMIRDGDLPDGVMITPRLKRWSMRAIREWQASKEAPDGNN